MRLRFYSVAAIVIAALVFVPLVSASPGLPLGRSRDLTAQRLWIRQNQMLHWLKKRDSSYRDSPSLKILSISLLPAVKGPTESPTVSLIEDSPEHSPAPLFNPSPAPLFNPSPESSPESSPGPLAQGFALTGEFCFSDEVCKPPRTCLSDEGPCSDDDFDCACIPETFTFCDTSAECESGEVCATNGTEGPVCLSAFFVEVSSFEEVEEPTESPIVFPTEPSPDFLPEF